MKLFVQMSLINISVEFVDENDPSRNGWVIEKIVIFDSIVPEGIQELFKNFFLRLIYNIDELAQFLTLIPNMMLVLSQAVLCSLKNWIYCRIDHYVQPFSW